MITSRKPGATRANSAASSSLTKKDLAPRTSVVGAVSAGTSSQSPSNPAALRKVSYRHVQVPSSSCLELWKTPRRSDSRDLCGEVATVASTMASKLGKVRSPRTSATAPIWAWVICSWRSGAEGVTSTITSRGTRSGSVTASRSAVRPPSDMPTTRSARGASSAITGATAAALSRGP